MFSVGTTAFSWEMTGSSGGRADVSSSGVIPELITALVPIGSFEFSMYFRNSKIASDGSGGSTESPEISDRNCSNKHSLVHRTLAC